MTSWHRCPDVKRNIFSRTFGETCYLTSKLIQQGVTGSTLDPQRHVNAFNVGPDLKAGLSTALIVIQRII